MLRVPDFDYIYDVSLKPNKKVPRLGSCEAVASRVLRQRVRVLWTLINPLLAS